jgi:hypothetical protein
MPTWSALTDELDRWADSPDVASFWWRDDDASAASPALRRLLTVRRELGVPLTVAAIPALIEPVCAGLLAEDAAIDVVQHGWDHADHALAGEKRLELGGTLAPPFPSWFHRGTASPIVSSSAWPPSAIAACRPLARATRRPGTVYRSSTPTSTSSRGIMGVGSSGRRQR